jgi:hypothetical protein
VPLQLGEPGRRRGGGHAVRGFQESNQRLQLSGVDLERILGMGRPADQVNIRFVTVQSSLVGGRGAIELLARRLTAGRCEFPRRHLVGFVQPSDILLVPSDLTRCQCSGVRSRRGARRATWFEGMHDEERSQTHEKSDHDNKEDDQDRPTGTSVPDGLRLIRRRLCGWDRRTRRR